MNRPAPILVAPDRLAEVDALAKEHGLDPHLLRAMAWAESRFDPAARSPRGAMGLLQVMPETARKYGATRMDDPADVAAAGARYLKALLARYPGDVAKAVAAYNCGESRVAKLLRETGGKTFDDIHDKLPAETRMYVPKIAALVQLRENADIERL